VVLSPFAPWLYIGTPFHHSTYAVTIGYHQSSGAWSNLVITLGIVVAVSIGVFAHNTTAGVVAATGFAALAVFLGVAIVQYLTASTPFGGYDVGWGLWLCFGASAVGMAVGIVTVRRISATARPSPTSGDTSTSLTIS